ncbi:AAA+ ATPase domain [Macleaya cordata]|uniref:microtubule-severing ATPase n=1 Tax=Macleaya cordata TaxID=56857 RepID=A0A200PMQ3_MACCD|nr:AAA+ ATPase domain [Macleaya cordata]
MNVFKDLIDSVGEIFSGLRPVDDQPHSKPKFTEEDRTMENVPAAIPGSNEKIAFKLKSYFELAKEEIAKAVRAEEWEDFEMAGTSFREITGLESTDSWCALNEQGIETTVVSRPQTSATSSTTFSTRKNVSRIPSVSGRNNSTVKNQTNNTERSKPVQESSSYDAKLVEMINNAIVDRSPSVKWEDVAGLEKAKQSLLEMVILPTKRKDLFTGLRRPARGLLLFGPPGNGKTMLAKAVASESEATFFNVSASSLTSKWVGEAEKLVRTLFMVAISRQPSVIFMDEIDSIMSTRLANENDASRRLKSEFLIQFDGVTSNPDDLVIVIGATNKPQELDDAVLRRLVKRIYVPLPDESVRRLLLKNKLKGQAFSLPGGDLERLVKETEGYSGSDLQALCEEAAMMPIRELGPNILTVKANQVRRLRFGDFKKAMTVIRPSLQKSKWEELEKWNQEFGSN